MLSRRQTLLLSAKGLAALVASMPFLAGCDPVPGDGPDDGNGGPPAPGPIDWEGFLLDLAALADEQFSTDWNQEAFVQDVCALLQLLDLEDPQVADLYEGYVNAAQNFPELTTAHDGGHFEVVVVQFEAGEEIRLHNHPDMTGAILCVSGEVDIENYDLLEETSAEGNLLLRRVEALTLRPGDCGTLTGEHGNIHCLVAREFTELLDVFTPPYDAERLERYRWYDRADEPYEGDDVFEAWES